MTELKVLTLTMLKYSYIKHGEVGEKLKKIVMYSLSSFFEIFLLKALVLGK